MDIKKALDETFQDIVRFIGAILFYIAVPVRAPRTWPAMAQAQRTPAKSESFIETRLYFLLGLTLFIYTLNQWVGGYLLEWEVTNISFDTPDRDAEAAERTAKIAQQLIKGVITDPVVIGSLIGAVVGTALLEAWLNLDTEKSMDALHDGLVIVSLATMIIYATIFVSIAIAIGANLTASLNAVFGLVFRIQTLLDAWSIEFFSLYALLDAPLLYILAFVMACVAGAGLFGLFLWLPLSVYRLSAAPGAMPGAISNPSLRSATRATTTAFIITVLGSGIGIVTPRLLQEHETILSTVDFVDGMDKFVTASGKPRPFGSLDNDTIMKITGECRVMAIAQNESDRPLLLRKQQRIYVHLTVDTLKIPLATGSVGRFGFLTQIATLGDDTRSEALLPPKGSALIKSEGLKYDDASFSYIDLEDSNPMSARQIRRTKVTAIVLLDAAGQTIASRPLELSPFKFQSCLPGLFRVPKPEDKNPKAKSKEPSKP